MERNRAKRKLKEGAFTTISGNYENADMVDFVCSFGLFDAVWIDMEHSPVTWATLADMSRAADLWGVSSIVRVRHNDPTIISLTLGEGVDGVIVPHVNTKEDAERVVDAAKFGPIGHRGTSGGRKTYGRGGDEHYAKTNDETIVVVMIEDYQAVERLPDILKVPHIDAFFVSHHDLSQSMGLLTDPHNPRITETFDRGIKQIVAAGKVAAASVPEKDLDKYLKMGVKFAKVPQWRGWIQAGATAYMKKLQATKL